MQVNITKRIDTPEGKRYCPVVGADAAAAYNSRTQEIV